MNRREIGIQSGSDIAILLLEGRNPITRKVRRSNAKTPWAWPGSRPAVRNDWRP